MIFVATKTSPPLWTQNLVLQGEQPGFTGVFFAYQPIAGEPCNQSGNIHSITKLVFFYSKSLLLFWCLISFSQGLWTRHNVSSTCSSPAPLHVCLPGPGPPPRLQSLPQHAGHRGVLLGGQQLLPGTASIHQDSSTYSSIPRLFSKRSSPTCGRSSPAGCWR